MLLSRGKTENIMENEDKNQEIASKTPVNEVPAATRNIKIEALLIAAAIAIGVLVAVIVSLLMPANSGETFKIENITSEPLSTLFPSHNPVCQAVRTYSSCMPRHLADRMDLP